MSEAHRLAESPDEELTAMHDELKRLSESSKSESSTTRYYEDGSVLVLRSRMGGEVDATAFESEEEYTSNPLKPLEDPQ